MNICKEITNKVRNLRLHHSYEDGDFIYTINRSEVISALELLEDKVVLEKPTIPMFVSKFLTSYSWLNMYGIMDEVKKPENAKVYGWLSENCKNYGFADKYNFLALLKLSGEDGYIVQDEPKFYVMNKIKDRLILVKPINGSIKENFASNLLFDSNSKFTEQEIKDYDARYWDFRVSEEEYNIIEKGLNL